jgi:hypothetical protein
MLFKDIFWIDIQEWPRKMDISKVLSVWCGLRLLNRAEIMLWCVEYSVNIKNRNETFVTEPFIPIWYENYGY